MQPNNGFDWFLLAIKRYAEFQGRSRRREFWYFMLFHTIVSTFVSAISVGIGNRLPSGILSLALIFPYFAVCVRRLHDTNRSGWWTLLPIANIIFWAQDSDPSANRFGRCPKPASEFVGNASMGRATGFDNLEQIEKLAVLRDKGVLTEAEFQMKKAALL
ncbi:DUF805 domain-containing protein [Acidisoma cellulosilytica]|uniref:DUF805 domain-containing protein n=1 Tax=Acidisoma cellulosilyticum TaxID=2802395 RepID=A0A963Z4E2_9PROT|nr:DUF805 domain-containing protein [Acidisoma cellulosilyticum]MCB8882321.1 DUF805 domain-containing protein [Acidisoma cellulosilyticum]